MLSTVSDSAQCLPQHNVCPSTVSDSAQCPTHAQHSVCLSTVSVSAQSAQCHDVTRSSCGLIQGCWWLVVSGEAWPLVRSLTGTPHSVRLSGVRAPSDTVRHKFGIAMSSASLRAVFLTVDAAEQAALPKSLRIIIADPDSQAGSGLSQTMYSDDRDCILIGKQRPQVLYSNRSNDIITKHEMLVILRCKIHNCNTNVAPRRDQPFAVPSHL